MTHPAKRKQLDDNGVLAVYRFLCDNTTDGKTRHGAIRDAAHQFGVSRRTVMRIRNRAASADSPRHVRDALRRQHAGRCGRRKISPLSIQLALAAVPSSRLGTLRAAAAATGISKSTLSRAIKRGDLKRNSSGNGFELPAAAAAAAAAPPHSPTHARPDLPLGTHTLPDLRHATPLDIHHTHPSPDQLPLQRRRSRHDHTLAAAAPAAAEKPPSTPSLHDDADREHIQSSSDCSSHTRTRNSVARAFLRKQDQRPTEHLVAQTCSDTRDHACADRDVTHTCAETPHHACAENNVQTPPDTHSAQSAPAPQNRHEE